MAVAAGQAYAAVQVGHLHRMVQHTKNLVQFNLGLGNAANNKAELHLNALCMLHTWSKLSTCMG